MSKYRVSGEEGSEERRWVRREKCFDSRGWPFLEDCFRMPASWRSEAPQGLLRSVANSQPFGRSRTGSTGRPG